MEYSDLGHAFTENMKIMSMRSCKWSDSLVVSLLLTNQAHLVRNLDGTYFFLSNCQIVFFFKLILFLYFTSSCDELYIFDLYLAAFVLITP